MRKYFFWTAALSFVMTPLMAKVAFSSPTPATSQSPTGQSSKVNDSLCYMQMPDGTILNLDNLCGISPGNTSPIQIPDVSRPNSATTNPIPGAGSPSANRNPNVSRNTDFRSGSGYREDRR